MDITQFIKNNTLSIIVRPNSKQNKVLGWDEEKKALRIAIKGVPDKGKANLELVKFIKKLTKRQVGISHGFTSREKILEFF